MIGKHPMQIQFSIPSFAIRQSGLAALRKGIVANAKIRAAARDFRA
jgi:hypothetical protein